MTPGPSSSVRGLLAALLTSLLLSGCTVYLNDGESTVRTSIGGTLTFGVPLQDVITYFEPSRGQGAAYRVGDSIAFDIQTTSDGYLTLTSIDPDGYVHVFARNVFVRGGAVRTIEGPDRRNIFSVGPPRGLVRIRASFTSEPTDTTRVTYQGRRGEDAWTESIVVDVRPFEVRDIAETHIIVR